MYNSMEPVTILCTANSEHCHLTAIFANKAIFRFPRTKHPNKVCHSYFRVTGVKNIARKPLISHHYNCEINLMYLEIHIYFSWSAAGLPGLLCVPATAKHTAKQYLNCNLHRIIKYGVFNILRVFHGFVYFIFSASFVNMIIVHFIATLVRKYKINSSHPECWILNYLLRTFIELSTFKSLITQYKMPQKVI